MNWSAILASATVAFALVVSVFAWIVTHPHKAAPPLLSASAAAVESPTEPALPSPPSLPVSATPAFHCPHLHEGIAKNIPLLEEDPPPLPPPSSGQPRHTPEAAHIETPRQQPAGETYGTQVLFLNNQATAADMARHERKLLLVMHISGNFEDSCFT
jgi:hypothetical protein